LRLIGGKGRAKSRRSNTQPIGSLLFSTRNKTVFEGDLKEKGKVLVKKGVMVSIGLVYFAIWGCTDLRSLEEVGV